MVQAACKVHEPEKQRSFDCELSVLQALESQSHPALPHLMSHDKTRRLLVTQPVVQTLCKCLCLNMFMCEYDEVWISLCVDMCGYAVSPAMHKR